MKSRTRYIKYNSINNAILVHKGPPKNRAYWHNQDNTIQVSPNNCELKYHMHSDAKEITYHQYIMWLCFGEPIVV